MPQRGTGDPLLKGKDWEQVKAYWRRQGRPCSLCGSAIEYRTHRHPRALHVGHIVSRDQAKAQGWTRAQINALSNTRPECATCSTSSGATYGNAKRHRPEGPTLMLDDW